MTLNTPKATPLRRLNTSGLLVTVSIIGAWQLVVSAKWIDYTSIPAPTSIAQAFLGILTSGQLAGYLSHTLLVAAGAAGLAMLFGVVIGLSLAMVPAADQYFTGTIDFMRTLPVIGLYPVVVLIWGTSATAEIAVATYSATWVVAVNTAGGVRSIKPLLWDVAKMFRFDRATSIRNIVIPAAMPSILVGFRLAVVQALVVAITAEMIVTPQGLGWGLIRSSQAVKPAQMWAYVLVAGCVGYFANVLLVQAVHHALPGSPVTAEGKRR